MEQLPVPLLWIILQLRLVRVCDNEGRTDSSSPLIVFLGSNLPSSVRLRCFCYCWCCCRFKTMLCFRCTHRTVPAWSSLAWPNRPLLLVFLCPFSQFYFQSLKLLSELLFLYLVLILLPPPRRSCDSRLSVFCLSRTGDYILVMLQIPEGTLHLITQRSKRSPS